MISRIQSFAGTVTLGSKAERLVVAALALLVVVFGVMRLDQRVIRQPAAEIRFGPPINHLTWDPVSGQLGQTGGDPYGFLQIPSDSLPLDELVLECIGPPPPGPSFIYSSPAYLPHTDIDDRLAVRGQVENTSAGFRLRFALNGSKIARLDLSDDLATPIVVREAVFRTHFLVGDNPTFRRFAASLGALLLVLGWIASRSLIRRSRAAELTAVAVLVAAKLWLAGDMQLSVYADARHDDALFLTQGHSVANGNWLGEFGELTLAKGPSYSVFIGLVQLSRLPLLDVQAWLHALACVGLVLAVRPWVDSPGIRLLLLGVLLFDPHPFSSEAGERALRSSIQPALTLLTLTGLIGVRTRLGSTARRLLPWSLLGGLALGAFWFSREEGVWIMPTLVLITGSGLWEVWRTKPTHRTALVACLLLPFAVWVSALWILRGVNHHYYGAWISVDMKDGGFPAAYGALSRITPATLTTGVPVTKESRLRAYAVSPAFAELQPLLEGRMGEIWASHGWEGLPHHPLALKEIRAGWFPWALRQAATEHGYYREAAETSRYWQRVADEINAACDSAKLAAGPRRTGFFPRWESSLWIPLARSMLGAGNVVLRFSDYKAQPYPSRGDPERIAFFARMLHEPAVRERLPPSFRTHLRIVLFNAYQATGVPATVLALVATLALAWRSRRDASARGPLSILLSVWGGALALILIVALVDVTSFSALHAMYLAPATPLILTAWLLGPFWAWSYIRGRPQ